MKQVIQRRFTLIEMLVVMSIIVVLAGALMAVSSVVQRGIKVRKTKVQIKALQVAFEQYKDDWGYYPQSTPGAMYMSQVFVEGNTGNGNPGIENPENKRNYVTGNDLSIGYVNGVLADAFGRPFYYQSPGTMNTMKFDLWSVGPDAAHGSATSGSPNALGVYGSPSDAQTENANNSDDIASWKRLD